MRFARAAVICVVCTAFAALAGPAGCSAGEALKAQAGFKDKICACADMACVKGVQKEQEAWIKEQGQAHLGASESDYEKLQAIEKEMSECLQKIVAKGE